MTGEKSDSDHSSTGVKQQKNNHHEETHESMRRDIDENTTLGDVKAPNVFERAKEEIEAVIGAIHQHKRAESDKSKSESKSEEPGSENNGMKKPNLIDSLFHPHKEKPNSHRHVHHHKETHGRSDDIDENTPVDEVKGPNVFERAKEEIEAIVDVIRPKKEKESGGSRSSSPEKERAGFGCSLGKGLQKICHPWGDGKKD
ncbi:PREDICTED: uncharacterized protein LOC104813494 [Tarenaya hassleriana]|uniref:uncharacterized protein LOC104813494 n=1 Tax=Tarenaya hassleriana TaxID=28532 RepID=UPI00053C405C|nr:PREDICTED: uncharacterized protein LOC104813494 [Tarenaya hassleriana]